MRKAFITIFLIMIHSIAYAAEIVVGGTQTSAIALFESSDGFGEISTEPNAVDFRSDIQNYIDLYNPTKYTNYGYISDSDDKVRGFDWSWGFEASNALLNEQLYYYGENYYQEDLGTAVYLRRYGLTIPLFYRFNDLGYEYTDLGIVFGVNVYNFDGNIYFTSECIRNFESGINEDELKSRIISSCPLGQIESAPIAANSIFISQGILMKFGLMNEFGGYFKLTQESSEARSKKYKSFITNRFLVVGVGMTVSFSY